MGFFSKNYPAIISRLCLIVLAALWSGVCWESSNSSSSSDAIAVDGTADRGILRQCTLLITIRTIRFLIDVPS